ncbi:MAG: hypothetical protein QOH49_3901 [Acidobacteriota bacterium]|jgi:hypothetical protein|nr:hypothetical protein [Acidobacteriota bacterium]
MAGKIHKLTSQDEAPTSEALTPGKKPYVKPRLSVHGNIEQITKGGDTGLQDEDLTGTSLGGGL